MQQQCLGKQRHLRRAEIHLSVMADNQMVHQRPEFRRKARDQPRLLVHHAQRNDDVAQQLAFGAIAEASVVGQFVNLADVVQHHSGHQQVGVHVRVVRGCHLRQGTKRKHVLDQPADVGVVDALGRGRDLVPAADLRVFHHGGE